MKIGDDKSDPCLVQVKVQGRKLLMEVDTGSAVAVISVKLYKKRFHSMDIKLCSKRLVVVNGSRLEVVGQISVAVELNGRSSLEKLIVLKSENDFTPLLGRDWMETFYPEWKLHFKNTVTINHLNAEQLREKAIGNIQNQFKKVFSIDFSEPIVGYKADLTFKSEQPIFKRAYQVPYKLKEKLLGHRLEQQGVISPIKASEWASPVIAIPKKDGEIRMISLAGRRLTAHRNQLKMVEQPRQQSRVFVPKGRMESSKRRRSISDEEDCCGFPDVPLVPEDIQPEKKRHVQIRSPVVTRSKAGSAIRSD
ncbi:uncharacterized protein K02A2.6-like [Aedes albopictus]|uniref:Peptidase A2 domain-containing protein n=1 Tax=Aedes albopictus TaxID=7160 RepID=A0ABM1Z766_AEDAL